MLTKSYKKKHLPGIIACFHRGWCLSWLTSKQLTLTNVTVLRHGIPALCFFHGVHRRQYTKVRSLLVILLLQILAFVRLRRIHTCLGHQLLDPFIRVNILIISSLIANFIQVWRCCLACHLLKLPLFVEWGSLPYLNRCDLGNQSEVLAAFQKVLSLLDWLCRDRLGQRLEILVNRHILVHEWVATDLLLSKNGCLFLE